MKMLTMNADLFDLMGQLEKDGKHPVAAHCIAADFGMMGGISQAHVSRILRAMSKQYQQLLERKGVTV